MAGVHQTDQGALVGPPAGQDDEPGLTVAASDCQAPSYVKIELLSFAA